MTKVGRFLLFILFTLLIVPSAFSQNLDFGDNPTDFGLFPTTPKNKHNLPECHDVEHIQAVPGLPAHGGYCLGPIPKPGHSYENKYAITLIEEYFDVEGLTRIVRRDPLLMTLAAFYNFCRPLGGLLSIDGFECEYKVKF